MNWEKDVGEDFTFYTGEAKGVPPQIALVEMWRIVAAEILPENKSIDWDHLKIEFWADSGRIIVYPASSKSLTRIERAGCQVIFPSLLESYEKLADSDISDLEFSERYELFTDEWTNAILRAAEQIRLPGVALRFWKSEEDVHFKEVTLI
ncbi:MAG: hypothetical protein HYV27_04235 [Candidatus Hydrogenedentes bacterium]|nr:hypothetical protein [Candidatus Hydrogenedentota bacterium]